VTIHDDTHIGEPVFLKVNDGLFDGPSAVEEFGPLRQALKQGSGKLDYGGNSIRYFVRRAVFNDDPFFVAINPGEPPVLRNLLSRRSATGDEDAQRNRCIIGAQPDDWHASNPVPVCGPLGVRASNLKKGRLF
jgi:hypothetical protein